MTSLAPPSASCNLLSCFFPLLPHRSISKALAFFPIPKSSVRLQPRRRSAASALPNQRHRHQKDLLSPSDPSEDEEEEEEDDDDDEAAEEYDEALASAVSEEDEEGEEEEEEEEFSDAQLHSERHESKEGDKLQRVERLLAIVRELGEDIIDFEELASVYDFPIDKFQRLAIQSFLRGSSVVVSAPTSSGKTLIAEAAAVATVAKGRRLFYTTPLKALSNQKFREFRKSFGENSVGLLTGDSSINKDAQILIMTTEILRNMLYQRISPLG